MFKNILIPVDGSKCSDLAVDYTLNFAKQLTIQKIVVIHVVNIGQLQSYSGKLGSVYYKLKENLREQAEELLIKIKGKFETNNVPVETKLILGDLPYDIVREASKEQCDLIIMGSRGSGGIESLMLGSVSNYVSKHAKCSVMIVRN